MKTRLIALFIITLCITGTNAQGNLTLWYKSPAKAWEEALPVGNGRMGAMIFGNPQKERIQFNENTLYSGEPETPKNINIVPDLAHIRQLLNEGKNAEAGTIMQEKWIGRLNEAYQPFGNLYIDFASKATVTDYIHSLDMENAVVTTSYKQNGVKISREVFASYPAQAIESKQEGQVVIQFVVTKNGKIIDPKVVKSVSPSLDAEGIRIINLMPDWTPGKQKNGQEVNSRFTLPVRFTLK